MQRSMGPSRRRFCALPIDPAVPVTTRWSFVPSVIVIEPHRAYPANSLPGGNAVSRTFLRRVVTNASCRLLRPLRKDPGMTDEELRKRLEMLRTEHRDLDAAIDALTGAGSQDQLQIARLKKRKLKLKDQIALVQDYLIPDIIA